MPSLQGDCPNEIKWNRIKEAIFSRLQFLEFDLVSCFQLITHFSALLPFLFLKNQIKDPCEGAETSLRMREIFCVHLLLSFCPFLTLGLYGLFIDINVPKIQKLSFKRLRQGGREGEWETSVQTWSLLWEVKRRKLRLVFNLVWSIVLYGAYRIYVAEKHPELCKNVTCAERQF